MCTSQGRCNSGRPGRATRHRGARSKAPPHHHAAVDRYVLIWHQSKTGAAIAMCHHVLTARRHSKLLHTERCCAGDMSREEHEALASFTPTLAAALRAVPTAFRQHVAALDACLVTLVTSHTGLTAGLRTRACECLALLPRVAGDGAAWSALVQRLLHHVHAALDAAFQGLDDPALAAAAKCAFVCAHGVQRRTAHQRHAAWAQCHVRVRFFGVWARASVRRFQQCGRQYACMECAYTRHHSPQTSSCSDISGIPKLFLLRSAQPVEGQANVVSGRLSRLAYSRRHSGTKPSKACECTSAQRYS